MKLRVSPVIEDGDHVEPQIIKLDHGDMTALLVCTNITMTLPEVVLKFRTPEALSQFMAVAASLDQEWRLLRDEAEAAASFAAPPVEESL